MIRNFNKNNNRIIYLKNTANSNKKLSLKIKKKTRQNSSSRIKMIQKN